MKSRLTNMLMAPLFVLGCMGAVVAQPSGGGQGQGGGGGQRGGGQDQRGGDQKRGSETQQREEVLRYVDYQTAANIEAQRDSLLASYDGAGSSISGDPNKLYCISKINAYGAALLDPELLIMSLGVRVGDSITIPSSFVSTVVEKLWAQRRYSDIQVGAVIDGDDVTLDFMFKEQPRVAEWTIEGLTKSQSKDLVDKLKLRRNSELSEYVIDKSVTTIKNYYAQSGFRNTDVEVKIDNDPFSSNMVNVTFVVDRKTRVRIGEIVFEGNEEFEDKRLRKTFKNTHQKSINIFQSRRLKESKYEDDKDLLIDFYNSKGYRNATIVGDSIYDLNDKSIGIKLTVSEGNKYYIRNIEWLGNSKYQTDMLSRLFGVKTGDVYDKQSMYKRLGIGSGSNPDDQSAILSLYQNEGYLMSQINLAEVVVGADSIDLEVKIFEGKPFTINDVTISGNSRVDDEVIRREIYTRPGELYNRSLLMQTMRTLSSLGHFNAEAIMPSIIPVSNSLVDIGWDLEEQASDQFNISGGWGSSSFVGTIGVTLNNLSVRNMLTKGAWRPYPMGQNQKLSIQAQSNGSYYQAYSVSFSDPWMGGRKPNSFSTSVYYSLQNSSYSEYYVTDEFFKTLGVSVGLGKRLSWPDPYFSLYSEISYQRYMLDNWSSFIMSNGHANTLSAKVAFARNSSDQTIYPRRGADLSFIVQATPPYSLFNDKDYSDTSMSDQDRYKWIEFHKWQAKGKWYQGFSRNSNLVLMLGAEMGYLGSYDKYLQSPFERFEVGGDGLSGYNVYGVDVIALRGYESGALDPSSSSYSMAYTKFTLEMRYPIILEASTQIYALGFLEAGNGFSSWREMSPFNIKRSAGVGVRFYLPIVGLMGIDWGYGFDCATGSTSPSGGQFHFVLGQQF
ncbi:MAG: outer membrane protein assembly factor BamA [Rikenellaceae bacterium]